ncbi:Glycoside hydrolase O-GlcNAcase [Intoshia linei]|uniref:Glycoside hydrolase O-GlcNAcase n=1 Tax=Intoshia linei TaxID=1819745 RepID=A0A177AWQ3_9BILA|nr:Glycoside hydrolase O-GlcNAcase [Intoshia linei]
MNNIISKFPFVCGFIEGFYGRPWSMTQRLELIQRLKTRGLNTYAYAPKDDYKHRYEWRLMYSEKELDNLNLLVRVCAIYGVLFVYCISPGRDIDFQTTDFNILEKKLNQLQSIGCSAFAILFDDIEHPEFMLKGAIDQCLLLNNLYQVLGKPVLFFCPTEYSSELAKPNLTNSEYLRYIGKNLNFNIQVFWTGDYIISYSLNNHLISKVVEVLKRRPIIWDNSLNNDYCRRALRLGPLNNCTTDIYKTCRGFLLNPNCEYECNYISLVTLATWYTCLLRKYLENFPQGYINKHQNIPISDEVISDYDESTVAIKPLFYPAVFNKNINIDAPVSILDVGVQNSKFDSPHSCFIMNNLENIGFNFSLIPYGNFKLERSEYPINPDSRCDFIKTLPHCVSSPPVIVVDIKNDYNANSAHLNAMTSWIDLELNHSCGMLLDIPVLVSEESKDENAEYIYNSLDIPLFNDLKSKKMSNKTINNLSLEFTKDVLKHQATNESNFVNNTPKNQTNYIDQDVNMKSYYEEFIKIEISPLESDYIYTSKFKPADKPMIHIEYQKDVKMKLNDDISFHQVKCFVDIFYSCFCYTNSSWKLVKNYLKIIKTAPKFPNKFTEFNTSVFNKAVSKFQQVATFALNSIESLIAIKNVRFLYEIFPYIYDLKIVLELALTVIKYIQFNPIHYTDALQKYINEFGSILKPKKIFTPVTTALQCIIIFSVPKYCKSLNYITPDPNNEFIGTLSFNSIKNRHTNGSTVDTGTADVDLNNTDIEDCVT